MMFLPTFALILALADAAPRPPRRLRPPTKPPQPRRPRLWRHPSQRRSCACAAPISSTAHGHVVMLRGVAFGNQVWSNVRLPRQDHAEVDYQRIAAMGMNVVRFYMNYRTFESDAAPGTMLADGWQWLDDNIAWAKKNHVYLVLNMHVPPGGFQSLGNGKALWDSPDRQERLIALWTEIARHTRGEPTVAGFDLLNEPVVTRAPAQWHDLGDPHRRRDPHRRPRAHAVRRAAERRRQPLGGGRGPQLLHHPRPEHGLRVPLLQALPLHPPERVVGPVHRRERPLPRRRAPRSSGSCSIARPAPRRAPSCRRATRPGPSIQGAPFRVDDPAIVVGKPVLVAKANSGRVYFDDLVLEELAADGSVKREIWHQNLTGTRGWFFWTVRRQGGAVPGHDGHGDNKSIVVAGTRGDANLGSDVLRFRTERGATYRLSGWMRGVGIPPTATCQIRLDFFSSRVPVQESDKKFVAQELDAYVAWGKRHKVPLFLGEWGAIRFAFDDDRGGLRWVADMLDLLRARHLHFSYHSYHEDAFGIYRGYGTLPDPANANAPLIELFTKQLASHSRK